MTIERTIEMLNAAVEADREPTYQLVYVDYRDELTDKDVAAIVRGDMDELYDRVDETGWVGDQQWTSACDIADELARTVVRRWEREDDADYDELLDEWQSSDERTSMIDTIRESDVSDWMSDLVRNTGDVMLRIGIETLSEDADLSFREIAPGELLVRLGFPDTPGNLSLAAEMIAESSTEFSVNIGYALAVVSVKDVYDLPDDGDVEIRNPHVYLGNPFSGSGWAAGPFTGTIRVKRDELRTDKDAFGYGWQEITGGVTLSAYKAEIAPVPAETEGN